MRKRKFKRIVNDKPYLIYGLFVRSRYEAQQMALASTLTIECVLLNLKPNQDISESTWARVDIALKAKKRKEHYRVWIKERFDELSHGVKRHRRFVAIVTAVALVIAFFTLIPRGRALAKGAFDYFANVFENHVKIEPTSQAPIFPGYVAADGTNAEETVNEYGEVIVEYDDFESFTADLGLVPVRLNTDDFSRTSITLTKYASMGLTLISRYTSHSGDIVITQDWLIDGSMSYHSNSDFWEATTILNDVDLIYAIDKADGAFDGIAMLQDSVLWISAQKSVDILGQLPNISY